MHKPHTFILVLALAWCCRLPAQQSLTPHLSSLLPLSPSEERYHTVNADLSLKSTAVLYANPVFTHWRSQNDTTSHHRTAIVYAGVGGGDAKGDFIPYEGNGATDYRVGAYGEYTTLRSGTLSGNIQYAQGKHRNIGWSGTRLPELYAPYFSTDSCGGDFKFESYFAEGNYGFSLQRWTLGVKGSFYGEQAYRLTDPRALNNTTWLRFNAGAAHEMGSHLLMLDVGYGRNKQHMQLRYWRPGQQDRFFVCYGFGLYDTRQSGVSFGKSRMYYIDDYNARLQYLSPQDKSLRLHASLSYAYDHMKTEESDIYNLYESRSHHFCPMLRLTYAHQPHWLFHLLTEADINRRRGYENIIEEYLIDKENNIYDFRTIDTRQNYSRSTDRMMVALIAARQLGSVQLALQGGFTASHYEEKYTAGDYRVSVKTLTPHAKASVEWAGRADGIALSLLYAHQGVGNHVYDVYMQNQQIAHLDFQQIFAPYAFRCANLHYALANFTWQHHFKKVSVGMSAKFYLAHGERLQDVSYTGNIGFLSTAPMISPEPDKHRERWCNITAFITF